MKKIRITEAQKDMLQMLDGVNLQKISEDISRSESPSAKVTDTFKSEVKDLKNIKVENVENQEMGVDWSELVPKVLDFLKKLYTNPSKEGLYPFWLTVGVSWDELIQMLTALDLIKSVKGGYRLTKFVNDPTKNVKVIAKLIEKMINDKRNEGMTETTQADMVKSFKQQVTGSKTGKTRQELLDVIAKKRAEELARRQQEKKDLDEADWFDSHPDNPSNREDNIQQGVRPVESPYKLMWFSDDISIFENGGQYYVYNNSSTDESEYAEYADREAMDMGPDEEGFADIEYGEWSLDGDIVSAYVNDNIEHLSFGKGLDDYENNSEMTLVTQDLVEELMKFAKHIGGEHGSKLINIVSSMNVSETTGASSSGAFVGKMGDAPISKGNMGTEMRDVIGEVDDMSVEQDIIRTIRQLTSDSDVSPTEWFAFESELKRVVDMIQSLKNEEWNPVIMFIVKSLQIAESVLSGDNADITKFKQYIGSLTQFINHFANRLGEATTVTSVGGDSGTFAYDAPVGDGSSFWTAGNKMNKKSVKESVGVSETTMGHCDANTCKHYKKVEGSTNCVLKEITISSTGLCNNYEPIDKLTKESTIKEDAKTDTQYPKGEFVEFDDCVRYNNNKVAQNGGCSTGAIDNVVKTKTSKNSVISDNALYLEISKATGRTITEVKSIIENKFNETK
jgi:hypothetical protein